MSERVHRRERDAEGERYRAKTRPLCHFSLSPPSAALISAKNATSQVCFIFFGHAAAGKMPEIDKY